MAYKKLRLDEKELMVLSELRKDSRQSLAEISRKTNIPVTTIFDKLKRLEAELIIKHTSFIDFSKIGFNIKVALLLKSNGKEELENFLINHGNINLICAISADYDYFAEGIFKGMGELYNFIEDTEGIGAKKIAHYYIEEDIKKEGMFLDRDRQP